MKGQKTIIIKKVKKHGHEGHHGGSWKVAYADFVTAMMAFFLLLWLITMVSPEKRARVANYFKYFSLYTSGGTSWMEKSSEIFGESGENKQKAFTDIEGQTTANAESSENMIRSIEKKLKEDIINKLGDVKDHILVDTVEGGVRIQMMDKEGSLMFELGSNQLTPKAKEILRVIGDNINKLPNKITIEGHTDALPYARSDYSNWELSTERASSARKELEANGLDPNRIIRVSGYAATDPLIKENPMDPRNRRISIIIKVPPKVDKNSIVNNELTDYLDKSVKQKEHFDTDIKVLQKDIPVTEKNQENIQNPKVKRDIVTTQTKDDITKDNENDAFTPVEDQPHDPLKEEDSLKGDTLPVIQKEKWNPVFQGYEWGPVLQTNE
jgi:chemotaxis protein MotB